jgi:hypothetical protein
MAGGNPSKLKPCTPENARERQKKSAQKRKENHAKKVLMSQIYADFLEREYDVKVGEGKRKISGSELVNEAMKKILVRGDNSTIALMKEVRETLEGQKINISGDIKTDVNMQSTEERLKLFKSIVEKK